MRTTEDEKMKDNKTRGGQEEDTGWPARPEDNSRTQGGLESRGGQDPDTEPGHRAWPQSSGADPNSKRFVEKKGTYITSNRTVPPKVSVCLFPLRKAMRK